jgi:ligand-binding sensor domain-containing protein
MEGKIIIGTAKGVFEFDSSDSTWHSLGLENLTINDLKYFDQKLYAATNSGIYLYEDQTWNKLSIQGLLSSYINSFSIDERGAFWVGTAGQGVSSYDDLEWKNYTIDGPPANLFYDMEIDDAGNLWCAHEVYGASIFDGVEWRSLDSVPEIPSRRMNSIEKDKEGNIWISSWGGGVIKRRPDDTWIRYTEENSPLKGVTNDSTYVVVNDMAVDEMGNRWFPNWEASDSTRVVCSLAEDDNSWVVFYNQDGIKSELMLKVFAWKGHLYICFRDDGLVDYNYYWTVEEKSDDKVTHYTPEDHYLSDDAVMCANVDKDDTLWVGTSSGLNKFDPDFDRFRSVPLPDPLGPQVNHIVVDERNNKWIATSNGLGMVNSQGQFAEVFTTSNSNICADNVLRLKIDKKTGNVWVGTDNGLSRFESGIGAPAEDLAQVLAYPNPFVIESGNELLTFDRLPYEAEVRIFTIAGELVKEIKSGNRWDGRNQGGELVAGGIYLFHVQDGENESAIGKIAVIRK